VRLVVALNRLDLRARLLARRGRVEVDERMPVDDPREDREVAPAALAQDHGVTSLVSAPWSTVSGRATHFIRDGRMSESSRSRMLSIVTSRTRAAGWPAAISSSTSADAAEMAQQSPVQRPSQD